MCILLIKNVWWADNSMKPVRAMKTMTNVQSLCGSPQNLDFGLCDANTAL
jgi:hypothetical protein